MHEPNFLCRICLSTEPTLQDMVSPCSCKGTMKYVHTSCLKFWRFRSKKLEDIRQCEQCKCKYQIEDEILPHSFVVLITSSLAFLTLFILSSFVLNLVFEAISDDFTESYFMFNTKVRNCKQSRIDLEGTGITIALFYQVFRQQNLFYVINFVFTLWRFVRFECLIDRLFVWVLCVHQFYCLVRDMNRVMDSVLVFVLNYS